MVEVIAEVVDVNTKTLIVAPNSFLVTDAASPNGKTKRMLATNLKIERTVQGGQWANVSPSNPPFIHRIRDRVFIGNAVGMGDNRSNNNNTWVPDTASGANWAPRDSQFVVMQDVGAIAVTGMSRSSDGEGLGTSRPATIGVAGFVINDGDLAAGFSSAWAMYADVQHETIGGLGNSVGLELAVKNKETDVWQDPIMRPRGAHGIWLHGGGDPTYGGAPTFPSACGITFIKNQASLITSAWNVGITFMSDSITRDGSNIGSCIRFYHEHALDWYTTEATTALGARIYSSVNFAANKVALQFDDDQIYFRGADNEITFAIKHIDLAVDFLEVRNATAAGDPMIKAEGNSTNVGFFYQTKGTGAHRWFSGDGNTKQMIDNTGWSVFKTNTVAQVTGWGLPTGTTTKTTFDTATVTLPQLAERCKGLIEALHTSAGYGLLGA